MHILPCQAGSLKVDNFSAYPAVTERNTVLMKFMSVAELFCLERRERLLHVAASLLPVRNAVALAVTLDCNAWLVGPRLLAPEGTVA